MGREETDQKDEMEASQSGEQDDFDEEERQRLKRIEAEASRCFDRDKKELDMAKMRVTNWVQNSHVHLPKAVNLLDEAEITIRYPRG